MNFTYLTPPIPITLLRACKVRRLSTRLYAVSDFYVDSMTMLLLYVLMLYTIDHNTLAHMGRTAELQLSYVIWGTGSGGKALYIKRGQLEWGVHLCSIMQPLEKDRHGWRGVHVHTPCTHVHCTCARWSDQLTSYTHTYVYFRQQGKEYLLSTLSHVHTLKYLPTPFSQILISFTPSSTQVDFANKYLHIITDLHHNQVHTYMSSSIWTKLQHSLLHSLWSHRLLNCMMCVCTHNEP